VVTYEYPDKFEEGKIPYYTLNDERNTALADSYREKAKAEPKVHFLGRLANYKYFDMDDTIVEAMKLVKELLAQSINSKTPDSIGCFSYDGF
jgi:UDP-galactopyranose mutase